MSDEQPSGRKSRSGSETRRRGKHIDLRVTDDEYDAASLAAERAGLSLASFARAQLLAEPKTRAQRRPTVERQLLAQVVAYMGRASGSLYQIARHLNFGHVEASADVNAALAELREAVASVMAMTGQQPLRGERPLQKEQPRDDAADAAPKKARQSEAA